jgi:hypothetical protein
MKLERLGGRILALMVLCALLAFVLYAFGQQDWCAAAAVWITEAGRKAIANP